MRLRSLTLLLVAAAAAGTAGCTLEPVAPTAAPRAGDPARTVWGAASVVVAEADVSRQAEGTAPAGAWVLYTRAATPGTGTFVAGPATPPAGTGSLELATALATDKVWLLNYEHVGTRLADVAGMGYSTWRAAGSAQQVAALNVQVDVNGDAPGGGTTLVFEPVYNSVQGAVVSGQWQTWDAFASGGAVWWSSNPIPGAPNRDTFVRWVDIVAANPDAVIAGGVGVNQGSGNAGLTTAVDALRFETTTASTMWDFESRRAPASAAECKNDGWRTLTHADGSAFRNQGECVSSTKRQ